MPTARAVHHAQHQSSTARLVEAKSSQSVANKNRTSPGWCSMTNHQTLVMRRTLKHQLMRRFYFQQALRWSSKPKQWCTGLPLMVRLELELPNLARRWCDWPFQSMHKETSDTWACILRSKYCHENPTWQLTLKSLGKSACRFGWSTRLLVASQAWLRRQLQEQ